MALIKAYGNLTKFGIVIFVLLTGVAGYATSFVIETPFEWTHMVLFLVGLYALSSGSLALNQTQESELDKKMPRTAKRPVASGFFSRQQGFVIAGVLLLAGFWLLYQTSLASFLVGLASVLLYNGIYTYYWKRQWAYAAVPGAIPGALPVTIGYAANSADVWATDSVYLFLIMFLWQMPHFWVIAIKFKDDYAKAGFPVLPVARGEEVTRYQIGLYTFLYVAVAIASPWFVHASWVYLALVLPFCFQLLREFYRYNKSNGTRWFPFFMWTNFSVLVFVLVPILDKWGFLVSS